MLRGSVGSDGGVPAGGGGVVVTTGLVRPASTEGAVVAAVVLLVLVIAMPSSSSLVWRVKCQYSLVPYIRSLKTKQSSCCRGAGCDGALTVQDVQDGGSQLSWKKDVARGPHNIDVR